MFPPVSEADESMEANRSPFPLPPLSSLLLPFRGRCAVITPPFSPFGTNSAMDVLLLFFNMNKHASYSAPSPSAGDDLASSFPSPVMGTLE